MTPVEIKIRGIEALTQALGFVGMVRYLHQFDSGSGNYTKEREQWLGNSKVQEVVAEMKKLSQTADSDQTW